MLFYQILGVPMRKKVVFMAFEGQIPKTDSLLSGCSVEVQLYFVCYNSISIH